MDLVFELGVSSVDAITIKPEHSFKNQEKMLRSDFRSSDGTLYSYKFGDFRQIDFKVEYVSNENAAIINSWWDSQSKLLFFVTSDSATEVHSVMIRNNETPLDQFQKPYTTYKQGRLILETY